MIGFIVGLFIGEFFGVLIMCVLFVAKQSDYILEHVKKQNENKKDV